MLASCWLHVFLVTMKWSRSKKYNRPWTTQTPRHIYARLNPVSFEAENCTCPEVMITLHAVISFQKLPCLFSKGRGAVLGCPGVQQINRIVPIWSKLKVWMTHQLSGFYLVQNTGTRFLVLKSGNLRSHWFSLRSKPRSWFNAVDQIGGSLTLKAIDHLDCGVQPQGYRSDLSTITHLVGELLRTDANKKFGARSSIALALQPRDA